MTKPLIPVSDAVSRITDAMPLMGDEYVDLLQANGRIMAEDVSAGLTNPPADQSAMDGFAIAEEGHCEYDLVGVIAAGQTHDYQLSSNQCFQIMTGANIPTNTIKVMRQEFCELNQNKMIIKNCYCFKVIK